MPSSPLDSSRGSSSRASFASRARRHAPLIGLLPLFGRLLLRLRSFVPWSRPLPEPPHPSPLAFGSFREVHRPPLDGPRRWLAVSALRRRPRLPHLDRWRCLRLSITVSPAPVFPRGCPAPHLSRREAQLQPSPSETVPLALQIPQRAASPSASRPQDDRAAGLLALSRGAWPSHARRRGSPRAGGRPLPRLHAIVHNPSRPTSRRRTYAPSPAPPAARRMPHGGGGIHSYGRRHGCRLSPGRARPETSRGPTNTSSFSSGH